MEALIKFVKTIATVRASEDSINGPVVRAQNLSLIELNERGKIYNSYGIYTGVSSQNLSLAMIYIWVDGKMTPKVVKPSPGDHFSNQFYSIVLSGHAQTAEERFKMTGISFVDFESIKSKNEVDAPKLIQN